MKSKTVSLLLIVLTSHLLRDAACLAVPMGTAFTYQGRFNSGGEPATGSYDFQFMLYDASEAGSQVGSTLTRENITVSDGYFTTTLDFGSGIFTGNARWLQIAVRLHGSGSYATLTPRHELTPTPYTFYASYEGSANYIPKFNAGGMTQSTLYDSGGNIGIGTTSPAFGLQVNKASIYNNDTGGALAVTDPTTPAKRLIMGYDATHDFGFIMAGHSGVMNKNLIVPGGNVGIGTTNPNVRLHVHSGTQFASGMFESSDVTALICLKNSLTTGIGLALVRQGDVLDLRTQDAERLTIREGGDIGIGTVSPVQKLDVIGVVRCVDVIETSDAQLKTDVQPLAGVLDKLDQVQAVSFRWNENARALGAKADTKQIGVLAQELEQVFPELVSTPEPVSVDKLLKNCPEQMLTPEVRQRLQANAEATNYKAVSYSKLTVVLLEAVKELKAENRSLQQRIQMLESNAR